MYPLHVISQLIQVLYVAITNLTYDKLGLAVGVRALSRFNSSLWYFVDSEGRTALTRQRCDRNARLGAVLGLAALITELRHKGR